MQIKVQNAYNKYMTKIQFKLGRLFEKRFKYLSNKHELSSLSNIY